MTAIVDAHHGITCIGNVANTTSTTSTAGTISDAFVLRGPQLISAEHADRQSSFIVRGDAPPPMDGRAVEPVASGLEAGR
jgi:hypothetical protein